MIDMNLQVRTTSRDDDNACLHITTNLLDISCQLCHHHAMFRRHISSTVHSAWQKWKRWQMRWKTKAKKSLKLHMNVY